MEMELLSAQQDIDQMDKVTSNKVPSQRDIGESERMIRSRARPPGFMGAQCMAKCSGFSRTCSAGMAVFERGSRLQTLVCYGGVALSWGTNPALRVKIAWL